MMKQYSITAAIVFGMALSTSARNPIVYVDITDGASGNTVQYSGGLWQEWDAFSGQSPTANDGTWDKLTTGNFSTVYQNAGPNLIDTNAPRLRMAVTVPAPAPGQHYNVYALFWTDSTTTWELAASVTNTPGPLPIYQQSTAGVTRFWTNTTGSTTVYSTNLSPNPFTTPVIISQSIRRLLMTPVLGEVYSPNIAVYLEPDRNQSDSNHRTYIDGIGYELIGNSIVATNMQNTGRVGMSYRGTAGRLYVWEWAASLNPPATWIPLQTNTVDSSGVLCLTDTPSGSSAFYRVRDVTPPPDPVINLTATAGIAQVSLSWTASAGATSYNLKGATNSGGPYTTIANLYVTNFVNTNLVIGTTYYYVVSALNAYGESANSAEASATPILPPAPTGLMVTPGNNLVLLNWTAPAYATSYNVKSATTGGGPYTTITNVTATSFAHTGLVNGTTYYYVVSALSVFGESANSAETNGTPAPLPPFTPTGLAAAAGDGQVALSWTASLGATTYNVKGATNSGGPYITITNVAGTSTVAGGLTNGIPYFFVVSAVNDYGESADSAETNATPLGPPPLVYSVENTGTNYPVPPLPALPPPSTFKQIQPLPDPFYWANDPLNKGGTASTNFSDWEHHRNEIKAQIEAYEIGPKPVVDIPTQVTATYTGGTTPGTSGTLRVTVTVGGNTLRLTNAVSIPAGATAPYPVCIGMDSPYGSLNFSDFTSRGIVGVTFSESQVSPYGNPSNSDPYHTLYGGSPYNFTVDNTGQYSAWAWGVSRVIDGLSLVTNTLPVDLQHICVTGCSYAGKLALFSGAFDERIALTVAQESGGGGANSWRFNHLREPSGSVELIDNTDYNWFANQMSGFSGNNVYYLPEDHHMLMAMCAPRALYCTGNTNFVWLGNKSCYACGQACARIYQTLGIADRFGFNVDSGHNHCTFPSDQESELQYFLDKFMKGNATLSQTIRTAPGDYTVPGINYVNYSQWTTWWGTTNAVLGP